MIIRFNIKLLLWISFLVVVTVIVSYFLLTNKPSSTGPSPLPSNVVYALEYFNAANSNSTILVPSEYYTQASLYSINNNKVIENDSEYANILLKNESYPNVNFVLIDMNTLNSLSELYADAGLNLNYSITTFPTTYSITNLSSGDRNCIDYVNKTDMFAQCSLFVFGKRLGPVALVSFPGSSTVDPVNASVFYNGTAMNYIRSAVLSNSTNFRPGVMFVYVNLVTMYLPEELMNTFYGKEMFLPLGMAKNIFDGFGEARTIKLN